MGLATNMEMRNPMREQKMWSVGLLSHPMHMPPPLEAHGQEEALCSRRAERRAASEHTGTKHGPVTVKGICPSVHVPIRRSSGQLCWSEVKGERRTNSSQARIPELSRLCPAHKWGLGRGRGEYRIGGDTRAGTDRQRCSDKVVRPCSEEPSQHPKES